MRAVLDSYAILTYIADEDGADKVEEYLSLARAGKAELYMNVVNLGEIYYILARRKGVEVANLSVALFKEEPIKFVSVDGRLSLLAGRIKAFHRLSYADAFAVATAIDLNATLVTGDEEFKAVEDNVRIEWL
ncbi:type II toxin-antitoxin system VapC family toxin [Thermococcus stetteri]|uniref:type II toxin-antitoxin system VapC family toxin n=1 Tax=Thermococcus stetteri TaxID=49900 RepID=UPI001AE77C9C|nr:type II toxin-antitoxin system VapC family toxin [Thermococcus stetteri]MBP1912208.1 putative nucleic acid-binding protein [Thermococcus stetteri]